MTELSSNKENKLFKDKLEELEYEYNHQDWQSIENSLNSQLRFKRLRNLSLVASIITVVSIVSWQFLTPSSEKDIETIQRSEVTEVNPKLENIGKTERKGEEPKTSEIISNSNHTNSDSISIKASNIEQKTGIKNQKAYLEKVEEEIPIVENSTNEDFITSENVLFKLDSIQIVGKSCVGYVLNIIAHSKGTSENLNYSWKINSKAININEKSLEYRLENSGNLIVELEVNGQYQTRKEIQIPEIEEIDFKYTDLKDPYNDLVLEFQPSPSNLNYTWTIEGKEIKGNSSIQTYSFKDNGLYDVELKSIDKNGCASSILKPVSVNNDFDPLAPNAFTPDGDDLNDEFIPVGFLSRDDIFRMEVYDIGGKLVYSTNSTQKPWNGLMNNDGEKLNAGIFIWKVTISNNVQSKSFTGSVRLIRKN